MRTFDSVEPCVDAILERVGARLRLATPLGIGKPNPLLNALYARAKADRTIDLQIYTALTLQTPRGESDLERRFLGPFVERVWGGYPELAFEEDRVAGRLPDNVRVLEFYFAPGKYLNHAGQQRDYISTNYTYAARDLLDRGVNVLAQAVARGEVEGAPRLSLSSNPDVAPALRAGLSRRRDSSAVVAQVNGELPFMYGEAVRDPEEFDFVVDDPSSYHRLFSTPKESISDADYAIGLYASTLIRDGGELQIGIGALGDALVYALLLRHRHNALYRRVLERLGVLDRFGPVIERLGGLEPFEQGLFAASEMVVDGFMHLRRAGILKRRVYDDVPLSRLLNAGRIGEDVGLATLMALLSERAVHAVLTEGDVAYLRRFGILRPDVRFERGALVLADGSRLSPNLLDEEARTAIEAHALGDRLTGGAVIHGGFFLGPEDFYRWLRELPEEERRLIDMRSIGRINQLYGHEELDRLHRRDARFVNTAMMMSLLGAATSDALEDGRVVSGVGGQYNFVAMAHALPDGHSLLQVRSTRGTGNELRSNLVWSYGHVTIPRHLRDVVITEHGIADIRGRTDGETIAAMLQVADARFQPELLEVARSAGKLPPDHVIDARHRGNTPERYGEVLAELKAEGHFPAFPFGTDLTEQEIVLGRALRSLKHKVDSARGRIEAVGDALVDGSLDDDVVPYLERMGLADAGSLREVLYQRLLAAEIRELLDAG